MSQMHITERNRPITDDHLQAELENETFVDTIKSTIRRYPLSKKIDSLFKDD